MNEDCSGGIELAKMVKTELDSSTANIPAAVGAPDYSLQSVLTDREALDCFRAWILSDPNRSADGLDLYFAIQGFKQASERSDPKALMIASQLHRRFISLNSGTCDFIYKGMRVDISNKVHKCVNSNIPPAATIFDSAITFVWNYLRQQHALFLASPEFSEFVNRYSNGFGQEAPRDELAEHCYVNEETFEEMAPKHPVTIASSSVVGSSVVDDDALPSTSGYQYHLSRNGLDESLSRLNLNSTKPIGISSSMTRSEPNVAQKFKLKSIENSSTDDGFGLKEHRYRKETRERAKHKDRHTQHAGMLHDRPEHRSDFANLLTQKLSAIVDEIAILERHFGKEIYAREVPEYREIYQKQCSAMPSQPSYVNQNQMSTSAFSMWSQPAQPLQPQPQATSMFHSFGPVHDASTTAATVAATSGFDADEDEEDVRIYEKKVRGDRSNSISPAPFPIQKPPRDRRFSPYGNGGFAPPPPPANSNKSGSSHHRYTPYDHRHQQFSYMGSTYMPQYLSFSDSSGFFSADSAHGNPNTFIDPARMKKLYEKARETNAQASTISAPTNPHIIGNSQTLMRKTSTATNQIVGPPQSATLPRPSRSTGSTTNEMTVSLREPGQMAYVSKCEARALTLREFRHLFGISSRSTKRFFFKSSCEDGDDPYQWTAVDHDDQLVPIFQGKVTAESRTMADSD